MNNQNSHTIRYILISPIEMKKWSNLKKSNSFRFKRVYSIKLKSNQMDKINLKKKSCSKKIHKGSWLKKISHLSNQLIYAKN